MILAPTLFAAACSDDGTRATGDAESDTEASSTGDSDSIDPTNSTTVDPDTSTTVDPTMTTTVDPDSSSTDPTDAESSSTDAESSSSGGDDTCGTGSVQPDEDCDGDNLDGEDCVSQGFSGGTLACTAMCNFDTADCTTCGDDVIEGEEQCEGDDLDGASCMSLGFDAGVLACDACAFDDTGCVMFSCGNNAIEGNEVCDGTDQAGENCISQGFAGGGELACAANCGSFDTTACIAAFCGNDTVDPGEVCDGGDLGGSSCVDQGFAGGQLGCAGDCGSFDTSGCNSCGDGVVDVNEECDGGDLGGATCVGAGFNSGAVTCNANCTLSTDSCFGLHTFCASPNAPIGPDANTVTQSSIPVGALAGDIIDVDVFMSATHTFVGDLNINVRHVEPNTSVILAQNPCGGQDDILATFDSDAAAAADCIEPIAIEGDVLPIATLDVYDGGTSQGSWELTITDDADADGGSLSQWCVEITNEDPIPACSNGAVLLATNPAGDAVVCDDPNNLTCEQNFETLCPSGWGLCTREQHNNRNDGFDYPVDAVGTIVLGEIYCRGGGAAGHQSLGPYDGITNLNQDAPLNCGFGSARPDSCDSGFGCNELNTQALCCDPNPLCGNGVVDGPEELCDDANLVETDACLNSCTWRVPTQNGLMGTGC